MNEVVVAVMIEKRVAMDDLQAILSVKGVDMVQFGPADYSISTGKCWRANSAELQQTERAIIDMALDMGVAPRVELMSLEQAEPFYEMGVRHFCIGWDVMMVADWCRQQSNAWKKLGAVG